MTPNINADHTVNIRMVIEQSKLNPSKAEIQVPNLTTVQVVNRTDKTINVDYAQVRGQWLASTIETPRLARKGVAGDSTLLYLVSKEPFHEALRR